MYSNLHGSMIWHLKKIICPSSMFGTLKNIMLKDAMPHFAGPPAIPLKSLGV